ncbi:DUF6701 domain-containing protein [Piscinibacter defluvii]|uniref:DUF6701 domain-containing protein n=1 Tax=Piscinibacter defluvii TaxID=1796922 RepID=UPI000FDECAF9|nr:DUF6701 domain-containing protein [Piscinibacter defluvii]
MRRLLALLLLGLALLDPARAAIVYLGGSSGRNDALPANGTAGALTITRPAGVTAGQALIASIAARPRSMTVTVPAGWTLMTSTNQTNGGTTTAPGGMTLLTYYKIVGTGEPANYTWTFANPSNGGGSAVGGILAFSGIDTSNGNPIDNNGAAWSARLTNSGTTHSTNSVTTVSANTMVVTSISYLSASSFGAPSGIAGLTERLDQSAPIAANEVGTTLQMSTAPRAAVGATGSAQATAAGSVDYGIGHIMALQPSLIDPAITMTRGAALSPGGTGSYALVVTNNGLNPEPGPLTVVDTLPAGLTYTSASGSGWSCTAAGQTVTCTRNGALAAGAAAATLTINVSVAAGASGTLTNTATVSGTGGDGNTGNNTASDSYPIPTAPYAYYALDESGWGTVSDSSGNGRNASALGSASPTGSSVPATPGAAIAGTPGTCGAGRVPAGTTAIGIDTGIDPNNLGNAGTIAFWYASSSVWNDGNARLLFDASNDLAGGDRHFFLVKDGSGILRFSLKDSAGTTSTAATTSYGYPANEWHHVTVTWNVAASSLAVYLDGDLAASSATTLNGTLGALATLYVGAQRMAGVTGTPAGYTANTANGYIDEVRVYNSALSALEVATLPDLVHTCTSGIDHYELSLPATGLACLPTTVSLVACTNSSSPCTSKATTLAGQTATLATSAGTLGTSTLSFDASGNASTTLSVPNASNGASVTVTLSGEQSLASNPRRCCVNGSSCSAANSCSITINTAGFVIAAAANGAATTVPTQTAGTGSGSYVLRAVQSGTATKACEAGLTGSTTVHWALQCNDPSTCSAGNLMTLTGSSAVAIAGNPSSGVSSTTAVPMVFDANGNAPFSFLYNDVGRITLWASKSVNGHTLSGSSNAFVTRPAALALSSIRQTASPSTPNPGATSATGGRFVMAGESFGATVTALTSGGAATPNFGRENVPEGIALTRTLVLPAGGATGTLANPTIAGGSFANGAATTMTLAFSEVGIITLTPALADGDYLGAGAVAGTTSGNVGRFVPARFALSAASVTHRAGAACSPASAFTYLDETFRLGFTLTAQNLAGATTQNYTGSFARLALATPANFNLAGIDGGTRFASGGASPRLSLGTSGGSWSNGVASGITLTAAALRGTGPDGPFDAAFGIAPADGDGVTLAAYDLDTDTTAGADRARLGTVALRYGRLRLTNAIGAADRALALPLVAQSWNGSAFDTNTLDSCTSVPASAVNFGNLRRTLTTADTSVGGSVTLAGGIGRLLLAAPGGGRAGSVDVALSLGSSATDASCLQPWTPATGDAATAGANLAHLRGAWCGSSWDKDPSARASFGLYRGADAVIYQRENY